MNHCLLHHDPSLNTMIQESSNGIHGNQCIQTALSHTIIGNEGTSIIANTGTNIIHLDFSSEKEDILVNEMLCTAIQANNLKKPTQP